MNSPVERLKHRFRESTNKGSRNIRKEFYVWYFKRSKSSEWKYSELCWISISFYFLITDVEGGGVHVFLCSGALPGVHTLRTTVLISKF